LDGYDHVHLKQGVVVLTNCYEHLLRYLPGMDLTWLNRVPLRWMPASWTAALFSLELSEPSQV